MKQYKLVVAALLAYFVSGAAVAETIRFWTTETQPDRLAKQQEMADDFKTIPATRLR